ncbi:MAG: hypothetical protein MJ108_07165 [Saccharofermentans sp.]|nr:hypothetical protein [Saccharofermentans sp.]
MKNIIRTIIAVMCMSIVFCGCDTKGKTDRKHHKKDKKTAVTAMEDMYSDEILVGYSLSGAGYGTEYECLSATVKIYKNRTVTVTMNMEGNPEAGEFQILEKDYEKLEKIINPDEIANLEVEEQMEVCDGNCNYLYVYDKDNNTISVGGYMPEGERFWEIHSEIREILKPYDVGQYKADYIAKLESQCDY